MTIVSCPANWHNRQGYGYNRPDDQKNCLYGDLYVYIIFCFGSL